LKNGMIAGVAEEGPRGWIMGHGLDDPLLTLPESVTITPGLGGAAEEIQERGVRMVAADIANFLKGEKPRSVLNPEVLAK